MKNCYIAILILLLPFRGFTQHFELGFGAGTPYYLGEINPAVHFLNQPNLAFTAMIKRNLNKRYALRLSGAYGKIVANDLNNGLGFSSFRNLQLNSNLLDVSTILEFNFFPYEIGHPLSAKASPYVFIGVSGFYNRAELSTNSDNGFQTQQNTLSVAVPFGVGLKIKLLSNLGMQLEWGMRKTFTDNFDALENINYTLINLSNKGNYDWYNFTLLTLNYKILTKLDRCPVVK